MCAEAAAVFLVDPVWCSEGSGRQPLAVHLGEAEEPARGRTIFRGPSVKRGPLETDWESFSLGPKNRVASIVLLNPRK